MDEIDWATYLDDGLPHPEGNYFNIESPHTYACHLRDFAIGHSQLTVYAASIDPPRAFELHFSNVQYLSAPIHWQGAQFRLGTPDECRDLRRKLELGTAYPDNEAVMAQLYKLFLLDLPNDVKVTILALTAKLQEFRES
ncbi:MAG: hypothetical protein GC204_09885 [Chloroflexi bacterium]|nr:hypothetical protein [Chloroflexota bacterium]